MKTVAIIQARMGSSRLPGKVLLDLAGEPMLARVVNRTRRATKLHDVVVATSTEPEDEAIIKLCTMHGWSYFVGSRDDVLSRYYGASVQYQADVIVRITSDCPLIEPEIVDWCVQEFLDKAPLDYTSNTLLPRTFPRGLDTEVIAFAALERAWQEDENPTTREHVTPYIYRHPEKFTCHVLMSDVDHSAMRWTVDQPEDLAFVRRIYTHFGHDRFSWREVLQVLDEHPKWLEINQQVQQKVV